MALENGVGIARSKSSYDLMVFQVEESSTLKRVSIMFPTSL